MDFTTIIPALPRSDTFAALAAVNPAWAGSCLIVAVDAPPLAEQIAAGEMTFVTDMIARKRALVSRRAGG